MKKIILIFLLFILHYSFFITHCSSQWVQQPLPVSGYPNDMKFSNQNTGWISMYSGTYPNYYGFFIKTTNGGNNWILIDSSTRILGPMQFFNDTLGYATGAIDINTTFGFFKTTSGGLNWNATFTTPGLSSLCFINPLEGWISGVTGGYPYLWKTTNSGATFQVQSITPGELNNLKFFKDKVNGEYYGYALMGGSVNALYKTTNSGINWQHITNIDDYVTSMFFINKDTGWVCDKPPTPDYVIYYTSNGGGNWTPQVTLGNSGVSVFFLNYKFGWSGSNIFYRIHATSNGGQVWGWQSVPTIFGAGKFLFIDSLLGWAIGGSNIVLKTTNGGGQINGIINKGENISKKYFLYQNYPNPFNPNTIIGYSLRDNGYVILKIYNILGQEISTLVNEKQKSGTYDVLFLLNQDNLSNIPTGIYFYTLIVFSEKGNLLFRETKKMLYIR
jgi:hypothetical protein